MVNRIKASAISSNQLKQIGNKIYPQAHIESELILLTKDTGQ